MRTFYSDYVTHALKYYAKYRTNARQEKPFFKSEADKKNWDACQFAFQSFGSKEVDMLLSVFSGGDTIPNNVYHIAKDFNISQDKLWDLITKLTRKVAKRRGLI